MEQTPNLEKPEPKHYERERAQLQVILAAKNGQNTGGFYPPNDNPELTTEDIAAQVLWSSRNVPYTRWQKRS